MGGWCSILPIGEAKQPHHCPLSSSHATVSNVVLMCAVLMTSSHSFLKVRCTKLAPPRQDAGRFVMVQPRNVYFNPCLLAFAATNHLAFVFPFK